MAQVVARAVHAVPDQLDVQRVLAEHELTDEFLDQSDLRLQIVGMVGIGAAGDSFADAADTLVGLEFKEEEIPAADVRRLRFDDHRL